MEDTLTDFLGATAGIVAAYVGNNSIATADLPALISTVHQALRGVGAPETPAARIQPTPAQIRRSITPDALISFEDGKSYRALKRHLTTRGMTLADYRAKWGLPSDYPSTAPSYSAMRSELAKSIGLGQLRDTVGAAASPAKKAAPKGSAQTSPATARRGRPPTRAD
jgi:predicted transcriptional regulator